MEINIDENSRIVEIWLTNEEKKDSDLRKRLPSIYREQKSKGYLVVVFESGLGDLFNSTLSLLLHNREVLAKQDMDIEKTALKKESA